jgi:ubiquinone/menaquinone biosynthesis C-methylase UbiE
MSYEAFDRIMQLATGYWQAAALNTAVSLGVFDALDTPDPWTTAEALAEAKGLATEHARDLLDALAGMTLLERSEAGYRIAPTYSDYLRPTGKRSMLGALRFNGQMFGMWGKLAEAVQSGQPVVPPQAHLGDDPARTRGFVMGMHSRALGLADAIVPAIKVAGRRHLLDIGAGPGTFSRQVAEATEGLTVTMLDLPGVVAVAKELTAPSPAADRIDFCPADYRRDALPTGCDAMLYCGALHQESEAQATTLFGRMHEALNPGGEALVIDLMTGEDHTTPVFSRLFSLNMKLVKPDAKVHAAPRVAEMLTEVGFSDVNAEPITPSPYWRVRGIKR